MAVQPDEVLRQAYVFASGVLAMRRNPRLAAIVAQAAQFLGTPIAAISIIDRGRQWFPAVLGLDVDETPRDVSFCAHAIRQPQQTLCVPDAREDSRFAANPLVTGEPHVRFYAGVPLLTEEGRPLGALCVIDRAARAPLTAEQDEGLRELAAEAVEEIERVDNIRRFGPDAIELVLNQIREAGRQEDEQLLLSLDRVLQGIERRIAPPAP